VRDAYRRRDTSRSVGAGDGDDQAHSARRADLLLQVEVVETRRKENAVPRLGGQHGALQIGESSLVGLAVFGVAARPDVDEPVHGESERRMERPVKG